MTPEATDPELLAAWNRWNEPGCICGAVRDPHPECPCHGMKATAVDRCRAVLETHRQGNVNAMLRDADVEVLLAVVEAAKELRDTLHEDGQTDWPCNELCLALARLYAGTAKP